MKELIQSLKIYLIFTVLLGVVYPLTVTAVSQITMPYSANGSLIRKNNKVVGSELIGQLFTKPEYFQSRPSAVDYNAAGSGGSNLGPSSKKLMNEVSNRIRLAREENKLNSNQQIPADMVLSSSSGLDPHISQENALLQVPRISRLRGIPESKVKDLIKENTDSDFIGIWGQSGVNVLKLNLALDSLQGK